jgi:general secretion pathway protein M
MKAVLQAAAPIAQWWAARSARDRRLLALAGTVLGLFIIWSSAVQPAWRTLSLAPLQRESLDAQWQSMQRLAAEAKDLRGAPPVSLEQSSAALRAATERLGDQGRLALQGERAVLTLQGASTSQLRDWLAEARSGARARPVEARLTRAAQGYSGTVVVALGGAL